MVKSWYKYQGIIKIIILFNIIYKKHLIIAKNNLGINIKYVEYKESLIRVFTKLINACKH